MSNMNPAGPNQPLDKHPLPIFQAFTLGGDSVVFSTTGNFNEKLFVPPPEDPSVARAISVITSAAVLNLGPAPADATFYVKDQDGREYVLDQVTVVPGPNPYTVFSLDLYLMEDDLQGYFVRVENATPDTTLNWSVTYQDVRGIVLAKASVTDVETVLSPPVPPGEVLVWKQVLLVPGSSGMAANFDSIQHAMDLLVYDDTGNSVLLPPLGFLPPATVPGQRAIGTPSNPYLNITEAAFITLAPGWSLRLRLQEALAGDGPVEVRAYFIRGNQSPVKTYQGGAY